MNKYRNKNSGVLISEREYNSMSYSEKQNYRRIDSSSDSSGDFLTSAVVGAVTDSAILGTVVGGSITGAILGDIFDGDLFD